MSNRGGNDALIRGALQLTGFVLRIVFRAYTRGQISSSMVLGVIAASGSVVAIGVAALGWDETMQHLNLSGRQTTVYKDVIDNMDPNEQQKALDSLKEVQDDMQKMGKVSVLAGTDAPPYWESEQKSATQVGNSEWACVPILEGTAEWDSLDACMDGNDIGAGGRDAATGKPYRKLVLAAAWRIENRTLWAKFAAERQQAASTMAKLTDRSLQFRTSNPHLRKGLLEATRPLRKDNGCNVKLNECYLFHGLGNPAMALNIIQSGMNEHFSGVNAGTMFGDGIYLAEDIGKSDQYCRPFEKHLIFSDTNTENLKKALFPGKRKGTTALPRDFGQMNFIFVTRTVLGVFLQVGANRKTQLRSSDPVFAAGTRELALIPDQT